MERLINTIVEGIQDKKGKDIVSLDLTGFDGAIWPCYQEFLEHDYPLMMQSFMK